MKGQSLHPELYLSLVSVTIEAKNVSEEYLWAYMPLKRHFPRQTRFFDLAKEKYGQQCTQKNMLRTILYALVEFKFEIKTCWKI